MSLDMWHFLFTRLDNVVHGKHEHIMFLFAHHHRHSILMPQRNASVREDEIVCGCAVRWTDATKWRKLQTIATFWGLADLWQFVI